MRLERWLFGLLRALMPVRDREWLEALIEERNQASGSRERRAWVGGAILVFTNSVWRQVVDCRVVLLASLLAGMGLAYLDLESASRPPYAVLLVVGVSGLSFWRPRLFWLWAPVLALCLPIAVAVGFQGPYQYDRLDAFYPLAPALAAAATVAWLRLSLNSHEAAS